MRYLLVIALSSSLLATQVSAHLESNTTLKSQASNIMVQKYQELMFEGIDLSLQQRQHLRDLIDRSRFSQLDATPEAVANLHQLLIAKHFDAQAYRNQAQKLSQQQIDRQLAMARIENQLYHLLTPTQQAQLEKNYEAYLAKVSRF